MDMGKTGYITARIEPKLKARAALHEPTFRVSMVLHHTPDGWRVIHFHESALSAQAAQVMSSAA